MGFQRHLQASRRCHPGSGMGMSAEEFRPSLFSGLAGWYRADQGITIATGVSQWNDLSGNGRHLLQGTGSAQPAFSATGAPNSRPCVVPDGTNDFLIATFGPLAKPTHLFGVWKFNSAFAAQSSLLDGGNANHVRFYRDAAARVNILASGTNLACTPVTDTAWHYHTCLFGAASGGTTLYKQDNVQINTQVEPGAVSNLDGLTLGAIGGGSTDWANCSIAEVIAYTRVLSASEEATVVAYMKARYAL